MEIELKKFESKHVTEMKEIWNTVVLEANAFPQIDILSSDDEAEQFFNSQSFTAVALRDEEVVGLYILHPNNIGRCGHISNASYAVKKGIRNCKIGRKLVLDSIKKGKELGFKILQFNAVVATNKAAIHLYEDIGFTELGVIPNGYLKPDNTYEDIISYIYEL